MGRDFTKYNFNGEMYTKSSLVLAVIGKYAELHPKTTFENLKMLFPDEIQAETSIHFSKLQLVFEKADAVEINEKKRFFMHDNELINLADSTIAIYREWNRENIRNFISKAMLFGFKIQARPE